MIIHIITILFVVLFWNTNVDIVCFKKQVSLPLSLVILSYILSVFSIFKGLSLFTKFSNQFVTEKKRIEEAKTWCMEAIVAYAGADAEKGRQLWQQSSQILEKDILFQLLSLANAKYDPESANVAAYKIGSAGILVKKFFEGSDATHSKTELLSLLSQYKLPWIFRALIKYNLEKDNYRAANVVLKQFFVSGNLLSDEWKELKAQILYKEAMTEENQSRQIRLYKKANKLDPKVSVFELVKHFKERGELAKSKRLIEEVWPIMPSIKLGKMYVELDESDIIPIHKFQHARALGQLNENHPISHILIATYAVESELWAIAYEYLNKFKQIYPELALILLARLESTKSGSSTKIWENIEKAFILIAQKEKLDIKSII